MKFCPARLALRPCTLDLPNQGVACLFFDTAKSLTKFVSLGGDEMGFSVSADEEGLSRLLADALTQLIAGTSASLPTLNWLAEAGNATRGDICVDVFAFVAFGLFTIRKSLGEIPRFMTLVSQKYSIPAYRRIGITDQHLARVKEVIMAYVLFLAYQVVQFPLTFGNSNAVSFYSDLGFQLALSAYALWLFRKVRAEITDHWRDDPSRKEKLSVWLNTSLDRINIRYNDMRNNLLRVLVLSFLPALLTTLPSMADGAMQGMSLLLTQLK